MNNFLKISTFYVSITAVKDELLENEKLKGTR